MYSPDGRWWWTGAEWVPAQTAVARPPGRPGLLWFTNADWIGPLALMGLIGLIPIIGAMAIWGWALEAAGGLRAGGGWVPRAGFRHLDRGVMPFLALAVYTLGLWIGLGLALGFLVALGVGTGSQAWFWLLIPALLLLVLPGVIALSFVQAAVVLVCDRFGFARSLDLGYVWRVAVADPEHSWKAAGAFVLGGLIVAACTAVPFAGVLALLGMPLPYLMEAAYLARHQGVERVAQAAIAAR